MSKNILVKIGGTDITSYVRKYRKNETYGNGISQEILELPISIDSVITLNNALTSEAWLDSNTPPTTKTFTGFIDRMQPESGLITLTCKDQLALLINKQFTKTYNSSVPGDPSYPDGKISNILKDIVTTYGGLLVNLGTYDNTVAYHPNECVDYLGTNYVCIANTTGHIPTNATYWSTSGLASNTNLTIQDSGTTTVLTQFQAISADPFERCNKLADTLSWVLYYRADTGFVYFEPKNFFLNPVVLTVGDNVVEVPKWDYDRSEMINDLTVTGAQQLVWGSEVKSGNASSTTFTIAQQPENIEVYYSAAKNYSTTASLPGEILIGNVANSLATYNYTVDKINKSVTFVSTPANSANNILISYSYFVPIPVRVTDDASITTYGTYAKTINLTDVNNFNDAQNRGLNILTKYAQPFRSTKLKVLWTPTLNVRVGQQINVIDNINVPNVNEPITIYATTDYYPENYIEVEVGDKQYTIDDYTTNVLERVKRLEDSQTSSTEASTEIRQPTISFDLAPDITTLDIQIVNDSYIDNHPINGALYDSGETTLLDDFETTTGWTGVNASLSNDATVGHFVVNTQGVKASWTGAVSATITKTISTADTHLATGQNTGTPTIGTIGLWCYATLGTSISAISLKIGSDASNYATYLAQTFAQRNSLTGSFTLQDGLNYLVFDLNAPTSVTGTPNWVATAYAQILLTTTATSNATFDYMTISKSDNIGLNGLGNRATLWTSTTTTW